MTIPVPAARPVWPRVVLMLTIVSSTLVAIAFVSSGPAPVEPLLLLPFPGVSGKFGMFGSALLARPLRSPRTVTATAAPIPADASTSAMAATAAAMRFGFELVCSGGGGHPEAPYGCGAQPPGPDAPGCGAVGGQLGQTGASNEGGTGSVGAWAASKSAAGGVTAGAAFQVGDQACSSDEPVSSSNSVMNPVWPRRLGADCERTVEIPILDAGG